MPLVHPDQGRFDRIVGRIELRQELSKADILDFPVLLRDQQHLCRSFGDMKGLKRLQKIKEKFEQVRGLQRKVIPRPNRVTMQRQAAKDPRLQPGIL